MYSFSLANDSDLLVQEQALNLIRNLACNKDEEILQVFEQIGEARLIRLLETKLASPKNEIVIQVRRLLKLSFFASGSLYYCQFEYWKFPSQTAIHAEQTHSKQNFRPPRSSEQ